MRSPSSSGSVRYRPTAGTTGRSRSDSLIVASRYAVSPARCSLIQPRQRRGVADQALQGPAQRRRRRLVPGQQQGHQLVAQLEVGQRPVLLVAGGEQQREHVLVPVLAELGAARLDLLVDDPVGLGDKPIEATPGAEPVGVLGAGQLQGQQPRLAGGGVEQLSQRRPDPLHPLAAVDAEDGAQDHLQGDRLHRGLDCELATAGPGGDRALGHSAHRLRVGLHPLAVEGRQQQAALAQVLATVEQQHRAVAEDRLQDRVAAPGEQLLGVAGEDGFDRGRVGGDDAGPVREPDREVVAVATPAAVEKGGGLKQEAADLERPGAPGSRRQCGVFGRSGRGSWFVDRQFNSAGISSSY